MREAVLRGDARRVFDELSLVERDEVLTILTRQEHDPSIDKRTTFEVPRPPLIMSAFDNGIWRITYQVPDEATIAVWTIRRLWPPSR